MPSGNAGGQKDRFARGFQAKDAAYALWRSVGATDGETVDGHRATARTERVSNPIVAAGGRGQRSLSHEIEDCPQHELYLSGGTMKRDMDLVRQILLTIEARSADSCSVGVEIPSRSFHEVGDHLRLMEDAGLVDGVSMSSSSVTCIRMTWQGYDFLEAARNDTAWNNAKDITIKRTGGLAMTAITEGLKVGSP